jgi:predicted ArsR family transcriptional regulator
MTASTLQEQARALGDPTRHAIFRHIVDAGRPVGVSELNDFFAFNHNAIRQHLAKLVNAQLVIESTAPTAGRGRPKLVYEVAPDVEGRWGTSGPYERLSRLLVEIIRSGVGAEEIGRRAAAELRVDSPSGDVVADVSAAMARQGFEPEIRRTRGGTEIVLRHCPFETAALADRNTVCALHLGIAEGLTEGTSLSVAELVAKDPRTAQCTLRLRLDPSPADDSSGVLTLRGNLRQ